MNDDLETFRTLLLFIGLIFIAFGALIAKIANLNGQIVDHFIGWGTFMAIGLFIIYKAFTMN